MTEHDDLTRSIVADLGTLDSPAPAPEFDDLTRRIAAGHRRQRRLLGATAVVVAIATGLGGYAIGHDNRGAIGVASDRSTGATSTSTSMVQRNGPIENTPTTMASGGTGLPAMSPLATSVDGNTVMQPAIVGTPGTMSPLLTRNLSGHAEIRAWKFDTPNADPTPGVLPAACRTITTIEVAVLDDTGITQAASMMSSGASRSSTTILGNGVDKLGPYVMIVVFATDAAKVSVTYADGSTDSMTPQNHAAIFARRVSGADPSKPVPDSAATITETAGDGSTSTPKPQLAGTSDNCAAVLPAPGTQPTDVAATRAAVLKSLNDLYDQNDTRPGKVDQLVDDPHGVADAMSSALRGSFASAVKGEKLHVKDLVFTSPDRAVVNYDIQIPAGSGSQDIASNRFGTVVLTTAGWKVTRATICGDISLAAVSCDGSSTVAAGAPTATTPPQGR